MTSALLALLAASPAHAGDNWFFLPEQASTFAADVDSLFNFINVLNLVFFVAMMGAVLFFVIAYRQRDGKHHATSPNKGNHQLELAWSVGPGLLLLVMFYQGFTIYMDMRVPPADAMEVRVQGQKWLWNYEFDVERDGTTYTLFENEALVVPVNTPVQLVMTSTDVLHSYYVPAFRVKQDVVPNRYTTIWFEAIKEGEFQVYCTEYCGTDHSRMLSTARVLSDEEYKDYIDGKIDELLMDGSKQPWERGMANFNGKFGCMACHSVEGAQGVGPHLDGKFGTEEELDDGSKVTIDDNYIRESIMRPAAKVVAGYPASMPPFEGRVSDEEMADMLAYIKHIAE